MTNLKKYAKAVQDCEGDRGPVDPIPHKKQIDLLEESLKLCRTLQTYAGKLFGVILTAKYYEKEGSDVYEP